MKRGEEMAIWGDSASSDLDDSSRVHPPSSPSIPRSPDPSLKGPGPAFPSGDPVAGPFVLAFSSASIWRSVFESTRTKLIDLCLLAELAGWSVARQ